MKAVWHDTDADIRDRVASVFEDDSTSWCQGAFAMYENPEGGMTTCGTEDGRATCWCVTGLIIKFEDDEGVGYVPDTEEMTRAERRAAIERFNDDRDTSLTEIIRRLRDREAPFDW